MSQRLRVAGWLRFASKSRLTKGLNGFRGRHAPGYYEADHWEISGLDAHIRLDAELPGDFSRVEEPFVEMIKAASGGYVDYFEDGNKKNQTQGRDPVKRWDRHAYDAQPKLMNGPIFELGTSVIGFSDKNAIVVVEGALSFADDEAAARANAPIALPYLTADEIREVRVSSVTNGRELVVSAACHGPLYKTAAVLEAPLVAWARAISLGATGKLNIEAPIGATTRAYAIEDGRESLTFLSRKVNEPKGASAIVGQAVTPSFARG